MAMASWRGVDDGAETMAMASWRGVDDGAEAMAWRRGINNYNDNIEGCGRRGVEGLEMINDGVDDRWHGDATED